MPSHEIQSVMLRDATAADAAPLAQLHVDTFNETHGRGPGVEFRRSQWESILSASDSDSDSFCLVLEASDGDLIGFARGIRHEDKDLSAYSGELNKIYLRRRFHRTGLGRKLICATAERFLRRGITSMLLFGDAESPTNGFYEAMGGERILAPSGEFHGSYGWRDLQQLAKLCRSAGERHEATTK